MKTNIVHIKKSSIEDMVHRLAGVAIEECTSPSLLVTDEILCELSEDAYYEAARHGLIQMVGAELSKRRKGHSFEKEETGTQEDIDPVQMPRKSATTTTPLVTTHPVSGRNPRAAFGPLERITMADLRGQQKALKDFTLPDIRHLKGICSNRRKSYTRRETWCVKAEKLVEKAGVEAVRELGKKDRDTLAKEASKAWA